MVENLHQQKFISNGEQVPSGIRNHIKFGGSFIINL